METLGARLRATRAARNLSRTKLSKLTGIGYSTIAEIENDGMRSTTKLPVLARVLDVSDEWLASGHGTRERATQSPMASATPAAGQDAIHELRTVLALTMQALAVSIPAAGEMLETALAQLPADLRDREFPAGMRDMLQRASRSAPSVHAPTRPARTTSARKRA